MVFIYFFAEDLYDLPCIKAIPKTCTFLKVCKYGQNVMFKVSHFYPLRKVCKYGQNVMFKVSHFYPLRVIIISWMLCCLV